LEETERKRTKREGEIRRTEEEFRKNRERERLGRESREK